MNPHRLIGFLYTASAILWGYGAMLRHSVWWLLTCVICAALAGHFFLKERENNV